MSESKFLFCPFAIKDGGGKNCIRNTLLIYEKKERKKFKISDPTCFFPKNLPVKEKLLIIANAMDLEKAINQQ